MTKPRRFPVLVDVTVNGHGDWFIEAQTFNDALVNLASLEFVELVWVPDKRYITNPWDFDERRAGINHERIVGVFDPDWRELPTAWPNARTE